jgi:hypothetical protein
VPVGPVVPVVPVVPVGPVSPVGPLNPVAPVAIPGLPSGPLIPVGPVAPVGPVVPVGPVAPVGPVTPVGPGGPFTKQLGLGLHGAEDVDELQPTSVVLYPIFWTLSYTWLALIVLAPRLSLSKSLEFIYLIYLINIISFF